MSTHDMTAMTQSAHLHHKRGDSLGGRNSHCQGECGAPDYKDTRCTAYGATQGSENTLGALAKVIDCPDSELAVIGITAMHSHNHCSNTHDVRESGTRSELRGEKVSGVVMQSHQDVREHVSCMLAHDLLNKVTAIVGFCELLESDQTENQKEIHLRRLRATALLIADMVNERSCSLVADSIGQEAFGECPMEKKSPEKVDLRSYEASSAQSRVFPSF